MGNIQTAIQILAGAHGKPSVYVFDAQVTGAVDEDTRTVEVTMLGGNSSNVITARLMTTVDDGAFLYPEQDSTVSVLMTDYIEPIIIAYSGLEKITWLGGDYGGVPIVSHPTNTNKGLLKRLNEIESKLNDHINKYNAHRHVTSCGAGVGSAVPVIAPDIDTPLTPTTVLSDIAHPNHKH